MVLVHMDEIAHAAEWDPQPMHPVTPPRLGALKRAGDDLVSDRDSPARRASPGHSHQGSPMISHPSGSGSSQWGVTPNLLSPRLAHHRSVTPEPTLDPHLAPLPLPLPPPPSANASGPPQPELLHTSTAESYSGAYVTYDAGDDPGLRSPAHSHHGSPMLSHAHPGQAGWLSPSVSAHLLSPRPTPTRRSATPSDEKPTSTALRHPPLDPTPAAAAQPDLLRTSQIPSGPTSSPYGGTYATYSNKAVLKLGGDLNQMAMGWSNEEWTNRRRLIQFFRVQEGNVINATFRPIGQHEFVPSSIVISCIFRDEWNECFVTSVDTIYLLEALVGVRFTVEEKNRIRRNLEGFKPMTVSKSKADSEPFFKLIMGFPNPKPRNIEKDVKVFPWKVLANALKKIIGKYSATYSAPVDSNPSVHVADEAGILSDPHLGAAPTADTYAAQPPPPSSPHHHPYAHSQPGSPHLGGGGGGGGPGGAVVDHFAPPPVSPHLGSGGGRERYVSQPPVSPAQGHRFAASQPASPHLGDRFAPPSSPQPPQGGGGPERYSPPLSHRSSPTLPYSTGPSSAVGHSHSRPSGGSFDFQAILESSQFAGSSSSGSSSAGGAGTAHAYSQGPPEGYPSAAQLFPSAEDYGVGGAHDRLIPPPLNHARSYSEGPRRGGGPPHHHPPHPTHHQAHYAPAYAGTASPYHGGADYGAYSTTLAASGPVEWDGGVGERRSSDGWKSVVSLGYPERRPASTDSHAHQQRDWDSRGYAHER